MTWIELTGSAGFLCYFLYDINSITWKNKPLQRFFLIGSLLVAFSSVGIVAAGRNGMQHQPLRTMILAGLAVLFFVGLIYTLFFALPFQETYVEENHERKTYTEGMYALCRHPGVLWFAFFYLALVGMIGMRRESFDCFLLIGWNLLYVILQDCVIFPKTFSDYEEYQKTTPFLIPNRRSIRRCAKFFRKE